MTAKNKIVFTEDYKIQLVTITSAYAKDLLAHNVHNRPPSRGAIRQYQNDMVHGRWAFNGASLAFAKASQDSILLDGQQRLMALAGIPDGSFEFVVQTGLDASAQLTMDQARKRSAGQQLALLGYKQTNQIAAAVRFFLLWESGLLLDRTQESLKVVSVPEIETWFFDNQPLWQEVGPMVLESKAYGHQVAGAFLIAAFQINEEKAKEFHAGLMTLVGLEEDSPVLALYHRLNRMRTMKQRVVQRDRLGYFIQAWNAFVDNKPQTKLQQPKGGWNTENFPKMKTGKKF